MPLQLKDLRFELPNWQHGRRLTFSALTVWGTWLVQSMERVTPDLGVVSSSPMLGVKFTKTKQKAKKLSLLR